jgi:hypothetical protein
MSRFARELREPWGILVGGLIGGAAWAVGVAPVLAIGAGIATLTVKVVAGLTGGGGEPEVEEERALPVIRGTPEAAWVARAEAAQRSVADVCRSARRGPLAERLSTMGRETEATLASIRRMAGQTSAVGVAMSRIDEERVEADQERLEKDLASETDPRLRAEDERSLAAVRAQAGAFDRMKAVREMLLARLESGAIGLEGVVARLAEVVALAETSAIMPDTSGVDALTTELEGLRAGLVEVEAVTERALAPLSLPDVGPGAGSVAPSRPAEPPGPRGTRATG